MLLIQLFWVSYILFHLKFQILLLQDKLNDLLSDDVVDDEFYQNHIYQELISIIEIHQKIKK